MAETDNALVAAHLAAAHLTTHQAKSLQEVVDRYREILALLNGNKNAMSVSKSAVESSRARKR